MPQYTDPTCGVSHFKRITIPFSTYALGTDFGYTLGSQDYTVAQESGDASISIKQGRFVSQVSAVSRVFSMTLYGLTAANLNTIREVARRDWLNFLSTGSGSITLDLDGNSYSGCYIRSPINHSDSVYDYEGVEIFDTAELVVVYPNYSWY
jgi:hypothetical protein